MKQFKLLLVSSVALLTIFSCKKEDNLCPNGYVDIYKSGSVKLIVNKQDKDDILDLKKGQYYGYKSCEVASMSAIALEDNTSLRVNGSIFYLKKGEVVDLTSEIKPFEYR